MPDHLFDPAEVTRARVDLTTATAQLVRAVSGLVVVTWLATIVPAVVALYRWAF